MYDTMRTAAGAAPLTAGVLPGSTHAHGFRALAKTLRQRATARQRATGTLAHQPAGVEDGHATAPHAQLLRQHHLGRVFHHRKSWFSALHAATHGAAIKAPAAGGQARPALGLWRHHGFFHAARHGGLIGPAIHGGWLKKLPVATAAHGGAAAAAAPAAAAPSPAALRPPPPLPQPTAPQSDAEAAQPRPDHPAVPGPLRAERQGSRRLRCPAQAGLRRSLRHRQGRSHPPAKPGRRLLLDAPRSSSPMPRRCAT